MKSLIFNITQSNVKGGMEKVFVDYAQILNNSNFKIICLTSKSFPDNKTLDKEKIQRINFNIKGHFDVLATIKLFILIKKYKPSLIIAHNGRAFGVLNLLRKIFKIRTKILAVSHGGKVKRLLNFNYAIGVANHVTNNIKKHNFKGETQTIYNGIKIVKSKKIQKNNKIFTFGVMSRLSIEKNIQITIKSFANFVQKVNKNSNLIIAGEGEEKEKLLKLTKNLKITDKVKFIGWIDNQEKFFNQIDIFIQSSTKESFGISIIEAFNYFCPVIASNIQGPKEIIANNKTGFLFDPNSEKSLFLKMKNSYQKQDSLKEISKNAHKTLIEKFSYDTMAKSLTKFINSILTSK